MQNERQLRVGPFVTQRIEDLITLESDCPRWGTITEKRHLRRRTKSHRSYKISAKTKARNLKAKNEGESVKSSPCREIRRIRNRDALRVWHAKRMKMNSDGIAEEPCDKGMRFMLQQSMHGCTVHYCAYATCFSATRSQNHALPALGNNRCGEIEVFENTGPLSYFANTDKLYIWSDSRYSVQEYFKDAEVHPNLTLFRLRGALATSVIDKALSIDSECWREIATNVKLPTCMTQNFALTCPWSSTKVLHDTQCETSTNVALKWMTTEKKLLDYPTFVKNKNWLCIRRSRNGWDLMMHSSQAPFIWQRLVFNGAVAAGIRNEQFADTALGLKIFPQDHPETNAYQLYIERLSSEEASKKSTHPLAMKPNWDLPLLQDMCIGVRITLRHKQATGAHARLQSFAKVFTKNADGKLIHVGYVTSCMEGHRIDASSTLYGTTSGIAHCKTFDTTLQVVVQNRFSQTYLDAVVTVLHTS